MTPSTPHEASPVDHAEVFVLSAPITPPSGVSIGLATAHEYVLVRLVDRDGRVGWGETYVLPGVAAAVETLAGLLLGTDPAALLASRRTLAATRASAYARSALLIALDDLRARQLGVPVHRLYGGPTRSRVTAYAASQGYVAGQALEDTWLAEASSVVAAGFCALKLRIGRYPVDREAAALAKVRTELPENVSLMADGNGGYTTAGALRMGEALAHLDARWFEEPLPQDGYHGYAELAARLAIPLAGGEIVETVHEAARLVDTRAVDILQPEPVICGGIDGTLRIADRAASSGVAVIPHTSGGAIGIAAALHVLACLEEPTRSPAGPPLLLELGTGSNPWRTDVLTEPLALADDGTVTVPTGPGLGIDVDEAIVRQRAIWHGRCG